MELLSQSKSTGAENSRQKTRVKIPAAIQRKLQKENCSCADCREEGLSIF